MNEKNMPDISDSENTSILRSFKDSVLAKMASIFVLILLLLIPLGMIDSLLYERLHRRDETVMDITSTWGKEQTIVGPVLVIPYRYFYKTWRDEIIKDGDKEIKQRKEVIESRIVNAFFLPSQFNVTGDLKPEQLYRGIYRAIVYTGKLKLSGEFKNLDFARLKVPVENILWDEAKISFSLTDLRGTRETLMLEIGKQSLPLIPGSLVPHYVSGVQTNLKDLLNAEHKELSFSLNLNLNGSSRLQIAPVGIQNDVTLKSSWQDPSFQGAFLPAKRDISTEGFNANWQISYYGRNYPQQWSDLVQSEAFSNNSVTDSLFGVSLISTMDAYRNVERSIKYGVLFTTLVFTAFFLFEVVGKLKIHPLQYCLVGAALCLFYLALLSLSEFISFLWAYIIAACASTVLITLYSMAILKSGQRGIAMAGGLIVTYGFLYITLQATDYALLIGTIGLFIALSLVMYTTRNIDWYAHRN